MSLIPKINQNNLEIEKSDISLLKTPSFIYSPKLKPEDSNPIPSPFILSNSETNTSTDESYPLSDNEVSKNNFNFKFEKCNVRKRNFSNINIKKKFEEDENEISCFFLNTKKYKEDEDNELLLEINEIRNEYSDNINDDNDNDEIVLKYNNNDDDYNLNILNILRRQKLINELM